jgi:hypothetical protein
MTNVLRKAADDYAGAFAADPSMGLIVGTGTLGGGIPCWAFAAAFRVWMLQLMLAAGIVASALGLAQASTAVAALPAAALLLWIRVYAGAVFEPALARVYAVSLWLALAVGLMSADVPDAGALVPAGATFAVMIEMLSRLTARLRADALTDPLTGLLNRKGSLAASRRAIAICAVPERRSRWPTSISRPPPRRDRPARRRRRVAATATGAPFASAGAGPGPAASPAGCTPARPGPGSAQHPP